MSLLALGAGHDRQQVNVNQRERSWVPAFPGINLEPQKTDNKQQIHGAGDANPKQARWQRRSKLNGRRMA